VRELEHLISRAVLKAMAAQPQRPRILTIEPQALGLDAAPMATAPAADRALAPALQGGEGLKEAVDGFQKTLIIEALAQHHGKWSEAARALGVDRANLNRLAKRLGIR
jgi:anaerobic nitric oxide reductase transcription regulator